MANNGGYRHPRSGVEWKPTKWDGFKLVKTQHPHRCQVGSGRTELFKLAQDGMYIGEWTRVCADAGFEPKFAVGSLLKLMGAKQPGWIMSNTDDNGKTIEQLKKEREIDPSKAAERAQKAAEKAAEKERLAAERAERRAAEKAEREAAKASKASEASSEGEAKAPKKRGKKKVEADAPEAQQEAAE